MTVSLGGISLSDHLVLDGIETAKHVAMSARRTLGGRMVIQVGATLTGGRELTLSGKNHFTLNQINAIKELEKLGQSVQLIHPRGTFVVFVTETPVTPTVSYVDPEGNDWYSGSIILQEG